MIFHQDTKSTNHKNLVNWILQIRTSYQKIALRLKREAVEWEKMLGYRGLYPEYIKKLYHFVRKRNSEYKCVASITTT